MSYSMFSMSKVPPIALNRKYAVELCNVSTTYFGSRTPAIHNVNLRIRYGEFILITGPNGAGKTTLLETILGLLTPSSGTVKVFGFNVPKRAKLIRRYCSYVPQDFMKEPYEVFTVYEVIKQGLVICHYRPRDVDKEIREISKLLGIEDLLTRPIGSLSGGQQQRVFIARALIRRPYLLLLDEPFSNLDRDSRTELAEVLSKLCTDSGTTIVMVSHDLSTIPRACTRIVSMINGSIVSISEVK